MIGFAFRAVGPRKDGRPAARQVDALQTGRPAIGGDDDGVIRPPRRTAGTASIERRQRHRRTARHRHFFQRGDIVHEPDPLAVGRDEQPARRAGEDGHRLERVERADEELPALVTDIDDAGTVGRDRQVTVAADDGQRGGTGGGNGRACHAARGRPQNPPHTGANHRGGHQRSGHGCDNPPPQRSCVAGARPMPCRPVPRGSRLSPGRTARSRWRPHDAVRSLTRQLCSSVRTGCGTSAGSASQFGSRRTTAPSTSVLSSPSNARLPVSISYRTQPNAQMSQRLSASCPFACSGDM